MPFSICCKDLGVHCDFVAEGDTGQIVLDSLMRHVQAEHTDDWYEIEEIHQAARPLVREKAA